MRDSALAGDTGFFRDVPLRSGSRNHGLAHDSACLPQRKVASGGTAAATRPCGLQRLLYRNAAPVKLGFFRKNHRQPGVDALPHLALRKDQHCPVIRVDLNPGVERVGMDRSRLRHGG